MANKSSVELLETINYMTALNCTSNLLIFLNAMAGRKKRTTTTTQSNKISSFNGSGNNKPCGNPNLNRQNWMCVIEFHILSNAHTHTREHTERKSHQEIESGLINQIYGMLPQISQIEFKLKLDAHSLSLSHSCSSGKIEFDAENHQSASKKKKQNQINPKFM